MEVEGSDENPLFSFVAFGFFCSLFVSGFGKGSRSLGFWLRFGSRVVDRGVRIRKRFVF